MRSGFRAIQDVGVVSKGGKKYNLLRKRRVRLKLIYKGVYKNNEQLPTGVLPEGAVKFKEAKNMTEMVIISSIFILPAILGVSLFLIGSLLLHGDLTTDITYLGMLVSLLFLLPHEFLHAVCFGKEAEVEFFVAPQQLAMFVTSTQPITKRRYIFMSLLPNLAFGWLPLAVWMILPFNTVFSNHLFTFSVFSILFGVGDYLNVFNAARQMPKNSMQQLSGFNSYWFIS